MTKKEEAFKIVEYYLGNKVSENELTDELYERIIETNNNYVRSAQETVEELGLYGEEEYEAFVSIYQGNMYTFLSDYFIPKFD